MQQQAPNTQNPLARAISFYQAGNLANAEQVIAAVLKQQPQLPQATHLLAMITRRKGQPDKAYAILTGTIQRTTPSAEMLYDCGLIALDLTRFKEAESWFTKTVTVAPKFFLGYVQLGKLAQLQGDGQKAIIYYESALRINPNHAQSFYSIGNVHAAGGNLNKAIQFFTKAVSLDDRHVDARFNLGKALLQTGKLQKAAAVFDSVIKINPKHYDAYSTLAEIFFKSGRTERARKLFEHVLKLKPDHAVSINCLGILSHRAGSLFDALKYYKKAIETKPDLNEAHNNLGSLMIELGEPQTSLEHFTNSININPNNPLARSNLLLAINYNETDNDALFKKHREWDEHHGVPIEKLNPPQLKPLATNEKLRVGFVSADFNNHPVGRFFLPLIESLGKDRIETFGYYNAARRPEITHKIQNACDHWRSLACMNNDYSYQAIRQDNLHILFDLAGHTADNRLVVFARKPAPIQINWLGYPNTTGMSAMDYRVTDNIADPTGETDKYHSETLLRMPNGFLCFLGDDKAKKAEAAPATKSKRITYGSFNNVAKVTDEVIALWSKLVLETKNGHLLIKSRVFEKPEAADRFKERFKQHGITDEHITMSGPLSEQNHLELYNEVDIALDPFPYNGTTTTCEALWMGVPVITLCGNRHASRVGASILTRIGKTDWIAKDETDYMKKAKKLAGNIKLLDKERKTLRDTLKQSPLCDMQQFAKDFETILFDVMDKAKKPT